MSASNTPSSSSFLPSQCGAGMEAVPAGAARAAEDDVSGMGMEVGAARAA